MSKLNQIVPSRVVTLALAFALFGPTLSGCNEHPVGGGPAPEFRGITVPLPPPSYRSASVVGVRLSGQSTGHEGGRATVWDLDRAQGIVTSIAEDGFFSFEPWEVNLRKHCFELSASLGFEAESRANYYGLALRSAGECTLSTCTAQDKQGECVCLEMLATGCYDRPQWPTPAPGSEAGE